MPNESAGRIIAKARQRRRMSQVELADALGVAASTVANWERDAAYPAKLAGIVEEFLGITIPPRSESAEVAS